MNKIGLCMIVKDEAKIIRRCLDSVKPLIDYVCITDTGSTDNTIEVINDWMKTNNIDGKVLSEPWKDFAHNRTVALENIRKIESVDYALMIDADEVLQYEEGFDKEEARNSLTLDLYHVITRSGAIEYVRPTLTKNSMPYYYKGVVYEFLECRAAIRTRDTLAKVYNVPIQDSARNTSGLKFTNDASLIERTLVEEKDPFMVARYTFYLAQTFLDLGQDLKALNLYCDRATKGFWSEEVFMSLLNVARLKEKLQYPSEDIIQSYMQAHESAPHRIEALHGAAKFCRLSEKYQQAYILSKWGQNLPVNKNGLFVEPWIWDYGIEDELSISAYWAGHYADGLKVTENLLNKVPEHYLPRVQKNLEFFKGKI